MNDNKRPGWAWFSLFALIGLGPLNLVYVGGVIVLLLNALTLLSGGRGEGMGALWAYIAGLSTWFTLIAFGGYRAYTRPPFVWWKQTAVLYAAWLMLAVVPAYLLTTAMGGVSMAVVDGVADPAVMRENAIFSTIRILLWGHLCILPWAAAAVFVLHRLKFGNEPVVK